MMVAIPCAIPVSIPAPCPPPAFPQCHLHPKPSYQPSPQHIRPPPRVIGSPAAVTRKMSAGEMFALQRAVGAARQVTRRVVAQRSRRSLERRGTLGRPVAGRKNAENTSFYTKGWLTFKSSPVRNQYAPPTKQGFRRFRQKPFLCFTAILLQLTIFVYFPQMCAKFLSLPIC